LTLGSVNQTMHQTKTYLISRNGIFYYTRRIPKDLQQKFNKDRVIVSLRTKSQDKALSSARTLSDRLERYWESLRLELFHSKELGLYTINTSNYSSKPSSYSIDDALKLYLKLKGKDRRKTFFQLANRSIEYLKESSSTSIIENLNPSDAATFREHLFNKGLNSASVRRIFSSVKSIINLSIKEEGLNCQNVFSATFIPEDNASNKRLPIPLNILSDLQNECFELDDENRWLLALISDTGMRLSEAVGLHIDDLNINQNIPYIDLKPHAWRSLKTAGSQRKIPLLGASFWAANKIKQNGTGYAFSRYIKHNEVNSNSASAAINKWLKPRVPDGCVVHSFRHSLRDRLRSVECPADIVDEIGGWTTSGVGQKYGAGYNLEIKHKWMKKIVVNGSIL